jgi:large subunit ribosomal protein L29
MAIIRVKELRELSDAELEKKLKELRGELMRARTQIASGAPPDNPGRIRELRKTIARILTILRERKKQR